LYCPNPNKVKSLQAEKSGEFLDVEHKITSAGTRKGAAMGLGGHSIHEGL